MFVYEMDFVEFFCGWQPRIFPDDTSITFASNSVEEINECINSDLGEILIWIAANKLTLNFDINGIFINWI